MAAVKGKNVVFMHGGKPVACARSYTDTSEISLIETTTAGSGDAATFRPQKSSYSASIEGVVLLDDIGKWTYPELKQSAMDFTLFEDATVVITDEDGNTSTETFDFYIVRITRTGAAGDFNTFQMDMQINGKPVIS